MAKTKQKTYGNYVDKQTYMYGNLELTGQEMKLLDKEAKENGRSIRTELTLLVRKYCKELQSKNKTSNNDI